MDFNSFIKKQYPLCSGLPFYKDLVSQNLYYKLAERSEADFNGRNLFEQGCANARICDDVCLGRPIPMYPELEAIVAKYSPSQGEWGGHKVWLIKVDTCKTCPFKPSCTKLCPSMSSFNNKDTNRDDFKLEMAAPIDHVTDDWVETLSNIEEEEVWHTKMELTSDDIAWDCLSEAQKAAVLLVQVQGKTYEQAAELRGVAAKNVHKAHESGMARLKEFGLARRALKVDSSCKYAVEYYRGGIQMSEIAKMYGCSLGLVHKKLTAFKEKHGIST